MASFDGTVHLCSDETEDSGPAAVVDNVPTVIRVRLDDGEDRIDGQSHIVAGATLLGWDVEKLIAGGKSACAGGQAQVGSDGGEYS